MGDDVTATAAIDGEGVITQAGVSACVPWWSFTKTVLAIAAMRLVERGDLLLDGELPGERFSLRQLLRHEAGLGDYGWLAEYHADVAAGVEPWGVERLMAAVDVERLIYEPGEGWAYSNVGYMKVVQMLERVSGRAVAEVLQDEVFGPAGVANARLAKVPGDLMDVEMGGAGGYHPGWVYHGLVVGTVSDAARVLWMLVHGRLLRAETFEEMLKGRALPEHHPDAAYGLGLMLRARETKSSPMGHTGEGPGGRIAVYANGGMVAAVWVGMPSEEDAEAMALGMIG